MPLVLRGDLAQSPRLEKMDALVEHPWRTQDGAQIPPLRGLAARFLDQFALRRMRRRFARLQAPRGQLPHPAGGGGAELSNQAHALLLVDGDDGGASRVV